jgi:hypothetical protein
MADDEDESLPFDVWVERAPGWGVAASALVIAAALLAALRIIPMYGLLVALIPSAIARRFTSTEKHVVVDKEGVWLDDELVFPRAKIVDAWFDEGDKHESRVTIADDTRLLTLYLPNHGQARRMVDALPSRGRVAGHQPELRDWVLPLRFVAIAVTLYAGSTIDTQWIAAIVVLLAMPGLLAIAIATRVTATDDAIELRGFLRRRTIPRSDVEKIEERAITLKSGKTIQIRPFFLRDAMLRSPQWLERALDRALG